MSQIEPRAGLRQRDPRQRDKAYLGFIASCPCLPCAVKGRGMRHPVEVCHIRFGIPGYPGWREFGRSERPHDWRTYPACSGCHRLDNDSQHSGNERAFWERMGVLPPLLCAALRKAYESREDGADVIRRAAHGDFSG